jgi:hypothetical protein
LVAVGQIGAGEVHGKGFPHNVLLVHNSVSPLQMGAGSWAA